jgi:hypothetical protein
VRRYTKKFDVRNYGTGWKPTYGDAANLGHDNLTALRGACDAAALAGGGDVVIPDTNYDGGGYVSGEVRITGNYTTIHNEGTVRFGQASAGNVFRFDGASASTTPVAGTTLYSCGLIGGTIRGHDPDDPAAGTRYPINIVDAVCTSRLVLDSVQFKDFITTTGTTPSKGVRHRGKELTTMRRCQFIGERSVSIEANPKERAGPAGPIDNDTCTFQNNNYNLPLTGTFANEAAIWVAPDLNFLRFEASGNNNVAGGGYMFYWDDPAGGALHVDSSQLYLAGFAGEQMGGGVTTANIHISRRGYGKARGVVLERIQCSIANTGIRLAGTIGARVVGGNYYRFSGQNTSPMALVLDDALTIDCSVSGYEIPKANVTGTPASLVSVGSLTAYDVSPETLSEFQLHYRQVYSI